MLAATDRYSRSDHAAAIAVSHRWQQLRRSSKISLRHSRSIADSSHLDAAIACSNYVAAVGRNSLQQPLSAIADSNFAAFLDSLSRRQGRCRRYDFPATIAAAIADTNVAAVDMSSLWHSRGIAASSYLAAAVACSNYVAAVDMTSLSAVAGSHFTAVAMSYLRQSLSIADNHCLSAIAGRNFTAVTRISLRQYSAVSHCWPQLRRCSSYDLSAAIAVSHCGQHRRRRDMISLRHSLSVADSHDFAAAIAVSNLVAAVDMTSLQAWLSVVAGRNFSAVAVISRRKSRSIADNNYLAAVIAGSNHVAAIASNSRQQSLYAAATGINYVAAADMTFCSNRCQPLQAAPSPQ